jgi:hypothetical protein
MLPKEDVKSYAQMILHALAACHARGHTHTHTHTIYMEGCGGVCAYHTSIYIYIYIYIYYFYFVPTTQEYIINMIIGY